MHQAVSAVHYELDGKSNLAGRFKSQLKQLFNGRKNKSKKNLDNIPTAIDWKQLSPSAPPLPSLENRLSQLFSKRPNHGTLEVHILHIGATYGCPFLVFHACSLVFLF